MKNKGFSLIELMVVVVIIGIMAGLAMVGFNPMIQRMRGENDAKTLVMVLREGQEKAINRSTPIIFTFASVGGKLSVSKAILSGNPLDTWASDNLANTTLGTLTGVVKVPELLNSPPGSGIDFFNNIVRFDPSGGILPPGGIYLYRGNKQYCVTINANGRIRRWNYGGGTWK